MKILILSCSTGGGHNAAASAISNELKSRGHEVTMIDPYDLRGPGLSNFIGQLYVKSVQKYPKLFGGVYFLGAGFSKLPIKSPVYFANERAAHKLRTYLKCENFDAIVMTHLYPAEMITILKRHFAKLPKTYYICTDYVSIPFTEETSCDYYFIPAESMISDFVNKGIPRKKLIPFGIPVASDFDIKASKKSKALAKEKLGLNNNRRYILLVGGKVGISNLGSILRPLHAYSAIYNKMASTFSKSMKKLNIIVICGDNKTLYNKLKNKFSGNVKVIQKTSHMADYMRACEMVISKPGGLSSTEAATARVPLIHISPIPGCELYNAKYFNGNGMSIYVKHPKTQLIPTVRRLLKHKTQLAMKQAQMQHISGKARINICNYIENNS